MINNSMFIGHALLKAPFSAWETTKEKHAEFYMPWQLGLTILKAKENKQVQYFKIVDVTQG